MDETWVHHFQPETKQQSKQWKHIGSLDAGGVLLVDYLDKDHTITWPYYADLLRQLWGESQADSAWKADKRSALPPGQCSGTHVHSGHDCYSNLWKTHPIRFPLTNTSSRKWKRSSVVIILPEMMVLWMLWTTFWETKTVPSTEGICLLHDCWTNWVNVGGNYVEKWMHLIF